MPDKNASELPGGSEKLVERYFTREQLRDKFRMKPSPGAEPVRMYKNPYGRHYGVWRLADCIPMREKRPQSEKQKQASARLGLQARMKSERDWLGMQAQIWLNQNPLFFAARKSATGNAPLMLEIGLVNLRGELIFEANLEPAASTELTTEDGHNVMDYTLSGNPSWQCVARQLRHHTGRYPLVIFSPGTEMFILEQTAAVCETAPRWLDTLTVYCAMPLFAGFYGPGGHSETILPDSTVSCADQNGDGQISTAVTDARMMAGRVNNIARYWRQRKRAET